MKRKHKRLTFVAIGLALLGAAAALMLMVFEQNVTFFQSPTDIAQKQLPLDKRFRLGGLVEVESVKKETDGLTTTFRITDGAHAVPVAFKGLLPNLFREGQGVVVEGKLTPGGLFVASEVLAKHDETYMPREVADALKKSGHWKPEEQTRK